MSGAELLTGNELCGIYSQISEKTVNFTSISISVQNPKFEAGQESNFFASIIKILKYHSMQVVRLGKSQTLNVSASILETTGDLSIMESFTKNYTRRITVFICSTDMQNTKFT